MAVIPGVTEGPNVLGSVPSVEPQPEPPSPFDAVTPGQGVTWQDDLNARRAKEANTPGLVEVAVETAKTDWALSWALMNSGSDAPDPDWEPTDEELKDFTGSVPEQYWDMMSDARSASHLQKLKSIALEDFKQEQRMANAGGAGLATRMLTNMADPVALGVSLLSEGAVAPLVYGAKIGRLGRMMTGALTAGASNAALEAGASIYNPKIDKMDMAEAFGIGMMFGGAFSALRKNPDFEPVANEAIKLGQSAVKQSRSTAQPGSAGAAAIGPRGREDIDLIANPPLIDDASVPHSAFGGARIDAVAGLGRADAPVESRLIAPYLGEESVALVNKKGETVTTPFSASEEATRLHRANIIDWKRSLMPAWNEWAKSKRVGWWKRRNPGREFDSFMDDVGRYIEDRNPTATSYDPNVVKAGEKARAIFGSAADHLVNPGKTDGKTLRSVDGFDNLTRDAHYLPKYADHEKINNLWDKFSPQALTNFVKEAVRNAMPQVEDEVVDRVANGWLKNITKAGYGIADDFERAFASGNKEAMENALTDMGLDPNDIKKVIARFGKDDGKDSARAMRRTPLDHTLAREVRAKDGSFQPLSMRDFYMTDVDMILQRYSREVSGRVSLAKVQVRDPDTGEMLIDGITTKAEFDKVKDWIRAGFFKKGIAGTDSRVTAAMENMDYLYRSIIGQPHHGNEAYVAWLRRAREYNFVRLMNRMGLAQAQEAAKIVTMAGWIAAVKAMPALKRIINAKGESIPRDLVSQELEAAALHNTDSFFGASRFRFNEEHVGESRGSTIGRGIDRFHNRAKAVTSNISLMTHVNTYLQRWASRAIAQRIADMAFKGVGKDVDRIRGLGIDEAMQQRIFDQVKTHALPNGPGKLAKLNLEQWEPEARAAYLNAIFRWTRRAIQENDAGGMARWMSKPGMQLFFQFRSFILGAWSKQTLYNLHMRDARAFVTLMAEIVMGGATHAVNVAANATARQDADEYLAKELSPMRLAMAGFGRAGIASIIPMVFDQAAAWTYGKPVFDARTSATPTQLIGGIPALDAANSLSEFTSGSIDAWVNDRELSQREIYAGARALPFGNWWPLLTMLSYAAGDRPYFEPK